MGKLSLRFLIDQNVPRSFSVYLRRSGFDVKCVSDIDPEMTDYHLLQLSLREKRIIISNDKDFFHLVSSKNKASAIIFDYLDQSAERRIAGFEVLLMEVNEIQGLIILTE